MTEDIQQRLMMLEYEVRRLKEVAMVMAPQSGRTRTHHDALEMDGFFGMLSQVLAHGMWGIDSDNQINKACLRVGVSSAHCIDEIRQTGPLGVSKGVNGRFLSQVDSLPAGVTMEGVLMSLTLTGKSSDYLTTRASHYGVQQLWYEPVHTLGLIEDLNHVMDALNAVERWLEISETEWTSTMGNPRGATNPHYIVRIGGDTSNLGTFREAIDRLRSEGGVDAWVWNFAPTLNDFYTSFESRRLCMSSLTIMEYLVAIGRIIGSGEVGTVDGGVFNVLHFPYGSHAYSATEEEYFVSGHPFGLARGGTFSQFGLIEFTNFWQTHGNYSRECILDRYADPDITPIEDPVTITDQYADETQRTPGLRFPENPELIELEHQVNKASAGMNVQLFRVLDAGDAAGSSSLEDVEEEYDDLWEYVDRTPSGGGDSLSLGAVQETSNTSLSGGVLDKQGPCNFTGDAFGGGTYAGKFEVETTVDGYAAPPAFDEYGPLDLTERYMANPYGFTNDVMNKGEGYVNLNSPVWQHNEANRIPGVFTYPTPAPEAHHFQPIDNGTHTPATNIGSGDWRSSDTSPFDGAGYPFESDDPADEEDPEDVATSVLNRLSGQGAATFDPSTTQPKKYFWAWPEGFTDVPDIASTLRPGGSMDGVTQQLTSAWQGFLNSAGTNRTTLLAGESYFQEVARAALVSQGFIEAKRHAAITFASGTGTSSRWICWTSPGSNGHSPFEEVVTRF